MVAKVKYQHARVMKEIKEWKLHSQIGKIFRFTPTTSKCPVRSSRHPNILHRLAILLPIYWIVEVSLSSKRDLHQSLPGLNSPPTRFTKNVFSSQGLKSLSSILTVPICGSKKDHQQKYRTWAERERWHKIQNWRGCCPSTSFQLAKKKISIFAWLS